MATTKPEEPPTAEQLPADPKAERKEVQQHRQEVRQENQEARKDEREDQREERKADRENDDSDFRESQRKAVRDHPYGLLGETEDWEDLDEPKPKIDVLPDHAPRARPITDEESAEYNQQRVDEEIQRLKDLKEQLKADTEQSREDYKDETRSARDEAKIQRQSDRDEDREQREAARRAERESSGE